MDRLKRIDKERFISLMAQGVREALEQVADAVNDAAEGNVLNGSEMQVREVMGQLRQKVFQKAVQMRIDSTESSFSPSEGCVGPAEAEQGQVQPQRAERQRSNRAEPHPLAGGGRRKRLSDRPAAG